MNYLIIVSKLAKYENTQRYEWLFEIEIPFYTEASRAWKELISKFPQPEYKIIVNKVTKTYNTIDAATFFFN